MKKNIALLMAVLMLGVGFTVSAFALDTPWLPIKPDTEVTEAPSPSGSESDEPSKETESATEATESGDEQGNGETTAAESDSKVTQATENEAAGNTSAEDKGCQSALSVGAVLTCGAVAAVCAIKSRKENE